MLKVLEEPQYYNPWNHQLTPYQFYSVDIFDFLFDSWIGNFHAFWPIYSSQFAISTRTWEGSTQAMVNQFARSIPTGRCHEQGPFVLASHQYAKIQDSEIGTLEISVVNDHN
jgi:hypothetical protein